MLKRCIILIALSFSALAWASPPLQAQSNGTPPTIRLQIRSLDAVIDNLKLLVTLAGREEIAKQVEGLIKTKIGAKGLEGVDPNRPFGAYIHMGQQINNVGGAALVPIADEAVFLGLLENLNVKAVKDANTGIYSVPPANNGPPLPFYFRFAHKYVYATILNADSLADKNLLPPKAVFQAGQKSAISAALQLDQIPQAFKFIAKSQFEQGIQDAQEKNVPGETPAQKAVRLQAMRWVVERFSAVLNDGKLLAIDIDVDKAAKEMSASFALTAQADSDLAKNIADIGKTKSIFGNLRSKDAAIQASVCMGLPKDMQKLFAAAIDEAQAKLISEIKDAKKKEETKELLEALGPTLRAGEVDAALLMAGPKSGNYTFIAAVKLHEGARLNKSVQQFLEDLAKQIPPEAQGQFKLNAEKIAGVGVHRFKVTVGPREKEILGNNPSVYLAIRDDAIFLAAGPDSLPILASALAASDSATVPPLNVELSLARLVPLMAGPNREKLTGLFAPGEEGAIRLTLGGGPSLRIRVSTHLSIMQVLGAISDKK